jgi:hypothetical protein
MSDVVISYARRDQPLAKDLAQYLQSLGFLVWWDIELLGTDDFNDVIQAELAKARAIIVIWSEHSVKSAFVRDEARFALSKGKLVATKLPGLDVFSIPFGFQGQHTDDIANRDKIVRAIEKLGAQRAAARPSAAEAARSREEELAAWSRAKNSSNSQELIAFLAAYPAGEVHELAMTRLRNSIVETYHRESKLSALLSGLTFRLADFLPIGSGRWAAIGLATAYLFITVGVYALVPILDLRYFGWLLFVPIVIVLTLGWTHFHKFIRQRLFAASFIVVLSLSLIIFIYSLSVLIEFNIAEDVTTYLIIAGILAVAPLIYALFQMRRAR